MTVSMKIQRGPALKSAVFGRPRPVLDRLRHASWVTVTTEDTWYGWSPTCGTVWIKRNRTDDDVRAGRRLWLLQALRDSR